MKGGLVFVISWSYDYYMQLAGSGFVKIVLRLLLDRSKHKNVWNEKTNIF